MSIKSWKNHLRKLIRKTQIHFFSLLTWAAQTTQTEEFMVQIVAYKPTVYRTGVQTSPNIKARHRTLLDWL